MHEFLAAVLEEQRKPLVLRTLEIPEYLSCGQVLVKINASGVCGAQINEQAGTKGSDKYIPHTLGHEGSGTVLATGPGVKHVRLHDNVVCHWRKGVGIESEPPRYWCSELNREIGSGPVNTFQEYSVVSENRLTKIPKDMPAEIAALLGCAVTTGLGLVSNEACVKMGQSVVVMGCGGVGLNVIQGCMLASAYPIVAVDIKEEKLRQALVMGATHVFNSSENAPMNIFRAHTAIGNPLLTGGADVVIDTTGNAAVMKWAWELAKPTGKVCLVAQLRHDQFLPLQTLPMHTGKTIIGSDGGQTDPTNDIPRYVKLLKAGRLNLAGLITHRTTLPNINATLDEIRAGHVGRAIIEM